MSDEENKVIDINEAKEAKEAKEAPGKKPPVPQNQEIKLDDTKIAYVVGLDEKGDFIFQVFGKEAGLLQLLGIHAHATRRIDAIYDDKQMAGDRLTHEVGRAVGVVLQKIDQLLQATGIKTPDNKL